MRKYRIRNKGDKFYIEFAYAPGGWLNWFIPNSDYIDDHRYSFEKQIDKWDTNVFDTIEEAREAITHKKRHREIRYKEAKEYLSKVDGVIVT